MRLMTFLALIILIKCDNELTNITTTHKVLNGQSKEHLKFIAIFQLSSLNQATEFGEKRHYNTGPLDTFSYYYGSEVFTRIRASQKTWAHQAKHFYAVVGNGEAERRVLSNHKYCTNLTEAYLHQTSHLLYPRTEQVFSCNGIRLLYLPECKDGGWGVEGPCCRCQGAMRYYLNMAAVDPDYSPWFLFSDDDYYTRLYR